MVETAELTAALAWTDVRKRFGDQQVLKGVSCSVGVGEVLALMGRSGSGKSTLLRALALLEKVETGTAWLDGEQYMAGGEATADVAQVRRRISLVFQQYNLFPNLTVMQNCVLGPVRSLGMDPATSIREANDLLEELGLGDLIDRYPETLSGGEAQRVAVARALLMKPRVLLLDEITAALDPESVYAVLKTIRKARNVAKAELAIVLVTHLMRFAQHFATKIGFLHDGTIIDLLPAGSFATGAQSDAARTFIERERTGWAPTD